MWGLVLNPCEERHRLRYQRHFCLVGRWRSVGSPPPDKAVWGRPPDGLPDWRNVILGDTDVTRTRRSTTKPARTSKNLLAGGTGRVHLHNKSAQRLEIPMAVTWVARGTVGNRVCADLHRCDKRARCVCQFALRSTTGRTHTWRQVVEFKPRAHGRRTGLFGGMRNAG